MIWDNLIILTDNCKEWQEWWQSVCAECASVCCLLRLSGYTKGPNLEDVPAAKAYWRGPWVQIKLPEVHPKIWLCPLAINGRCLIYEDRPLICALFLGCNWKYPYADELGAEAEKVA